MSVNSNDNVNNSRILRSSGKKTPKLVPRYSKAFPKDFFDESKLNRIDDFVIDSSIKLSTEKSPTNDMGYLRHNFNPTKEFSYDNVSTSQEIGYNIPFSSAHRRNSSNFAAKPIKPFDKRMTPNLESRKVFQDLNSITFRHQDPKLQDLKKKKFERNLFNIDPDHEDKENLIPNFQIEPKSKNENSQQGTPGFKCAVSREDMMKGFKPRRIDMDLELEKQNEEAQNARFSVRREAQSPIVDDTHKPIFKIKKGLNLNFKWEK